MVALNLVAEIPAVNVRIPGTIDFAEVISLTAKSKKVLKTVINLLAKGT